MADDAHSKGAGDAGVGGMGGDAKKALRVAPASGQCHVLCVWEGGKGLRFEVYFRGNEVWKIMKIEQLTLSYIPRTI